MKPETTVPPPSTCLSLLKQDKPRGHALQEDTRLACSTVGRGERAPTPTTGESTPSRFLETPVFSLPAESLLPDSLHRILHNVRNSNITSLHQQPCP